MSKQDWKLFLSDSKSKIEFACSVLFLFIVLLAFTQFLNYVEVRDGFVFNDPILSCFPAVDVTWFTFATIYFSLIFAIYYFSKRPNLLLLALQAFGIMVLFRMAAMYLLPLNPPQTMIPLTDPFVEFFGTGKTLTRDLFFSGHTATLFLFFLVSPRGSVKTIFFILTIFVAASVLAQHVHYSIDVFAAPFFAYAAYRTAIKLRSIVLNN